MTTVTVVSGSPLLSNRIGRESGFHAPHVTTSPDPDLLAMGSAMPSHVETAEKSAVAPQLTVQHDCENMASRVRVERPRVFCPLLHRRARQLAELARRAAEEAAADLPAVPKGSNPSYTTTGQHTGRVRAASIP